VDEQRSVGKKAPTFFAVRNAVTYERTQTELTLAESVTYTVL